VKSNKSYTVVLGSTEILDKYGIVLGGDQLTRVRLESAKQMRMLSPENYKRFHHLRTICEMWHTKQDLLEVGNIIG